MPTIKEKFKNPRLRLYDINKNYICELTGNSLRNSAYSIKRTKKINEIETLSFSIPYDNEYIGLGSCEYLIRHEFAWFIIKSISLSSSDVRVLEVECESSFTISKTIMCEEAELIGLSPIEMFEGIMASATNNSLNYIWKGTDVDSYRSITVESESSIFENLINMAEAFNSIIEMEYDSDGNNTIFLRHNPYDRKKLIRKDRDISQLDINYDTSALFTRVLALGYTDDDGIELNLIDKVGKSYLEDYSYFKKKGMTDQEIANNPQCLAMQVVRYPDIVDVEDLMVAAQEELERCSMPRVTGSVKFSDLSVLEDCSVIEPILYEKLYIIDKTINMVFTANITEIEYDYDNILEGNISMDSLITYSSVFTDLVNNSEKVDKITTTNPITGKPSLVAGLVQGILNTNIVHIAGQLEGIEKPEDKTAILFECRDVSMPELFGGLAIGSRGILIADSLNPDNSWNWKTAISAKGLSTELVSTIQLVAEQITAGTLSSADKSTWINLDTGEFNFKDKIKFVDGEYSINLGDIDLGELDLSNVLTKTEYERDKNSIVSSMDIERLGNWLLDFQKEKEGLYEQYQPLYEDTINLTTAERNDLKQSWDEYEYEYGVITGLIGNIINDEVVTVAEKRQYDTEVSVYIGKYKSLVSKLQRYWTISNIHYTNTQISVTQSSILSTIESTYVQREELDSSIYYSLSLSNEYQGIPVDADGFPVENVNFETKLSVYKGSQLMNIYTINSIASSDGITATIDSANKKITFTKPKTSRFTLKGGTLRISITIEGIELYKDLTWSTISPGKDGNEGTPGINSYLHIMYAPNGNPTSAEMTKIPDIYMGVYTDNIEADSTDPTKYKWNKVKGEDGTSVNIKDTLESTTQLPSDASSGDGYLVGNDLWIMTDVGTWTKVESFKGQDGKSRYIHIKYSDDGGLTFTANGGETTGKYMGIYVDDVELDSTNVLDYTWTQIMGVSSYFHVKYAPNNNPTADQMSEYPKEYIGTYVDNIEEDSTDPTKYTWVRLEGKDGVAGKDGTNGKTYYFHVKYSDDEGRTFTSNNGEDVGKYMGTLVDMVETDSNDPADYKWAKVQGDDGATCNIECATTTFKSGDGGATFTPSSIVLKPKFGNCNYIKWQYSVNGSTYQDVTSSTSGVSVNSSTKNLTVYQSSTLFDSNNTVSANKNKPISFKVITDNELVFDVVTITKLSILEDANDLIITTVNTQIAQETDNIRLSVNTLERKLNGNYVSNPSFKVNANDWASSDSALTVKRYYSATYGTWGNFVCTATEGQKYGYILIDVPSGEALNFSCKVATTNSSYLRYNIKLQYQTVGGSWANYKIFSGNLSSTNSLSSPLTLSCKTSAMSTTRYRIYIDKEDGYGMNIYITDVTLIGDETLVRQSSLELLQDEINLKVSNGDLGTLIQQNPTWVKIAWNNISNYVQFENGGVSIYNGSVTTSQKRSVFNETGLHFWRDGYYLGKIGTNYYQNSTTVRGLVFDIEYNTSYMTWARKRNSSDTTYSMMWTYTNKTTGDYTANRLHAGCDIDMHNYYLRNVNFEGGGINGTLNFVQVLGVNSSGTLSSWSNNCRMVFQNGILVDATWHD